MMKRSCLLITSSACIAFALLGCGDVDPPYSSLVTYALRTDPIVADKLGDESDEVFEPDRPGQLPLFSFADWRDPLHPLHKKSAMWIDKGLLRDPTEVPTTMRDDLDRLLTDVFGTPAEPIVSEKVIGEAASEILKLDVRSLQRGSIIYRVQCLHCHGVTGDGRGPTAKWVNPHPRDYRQGLFKFQSVNQTAKLERPPRRADLHRVIKYGIEGTAMPSFVLLPDSDIDMVVSYVIHLSIRGQVEYLAFRDNIDPKKRPVMGWVDPIDRFVADYTNIIARRWVDSQKDEIKIEP
ncbi:MAG: cytochrome c, partial [Gemmataceae bacterium]|nr:cytochrome c [Gemmataceae bacterium]